MRVVERRASSLYIPLTSDLWWKSAEGDKFMLRDFKMNYKYLSYLKQTFFNLFNVFEIEI